MSEIDKPSWRRGRLGGLPWSPTIPRPLLALARGGADVGRRVLGAFAAGDRPGRSERFTGFLSEQVGVKDAPQLSAGETDLQMTVKAEEGFGKPALVSIELLGAMPADDPSRTLLLRLMDQLVRAAWDNPEIAPITVRIRVRLLDANGVVKLQLDARDLGFPDEMVRPSELYTRYSSPASDPGWRPLL